MALTRTSIEKEEGSVASMDGDTHDKVSCSEGTPEDHGDDNEEEDEAETEDGEENSSKSSAGTSAGSTSRGGSKQQQHNQKERAQEDKILGNELNRQVFRIRLLVVLVLVVSTVAVAFLVYDYIDNQENTDFEESFVADANKIIVSLGSKVDLTLGALDSFVVGLASYAEISNSTWPFVTVPDFGVKAKKIQSLSSGVWMAIYPAITNETRDAWEVYTGENNYWVNQTIESQEFDSTYHNEVNYSWVEHNIIHNDWGDMPYNRTSLLPMWQNYPVIPCSYGCPIYNWDVLGITDSWSLERTLVEGKVVLNEAYHLPDLNDPKWVEENEWDIEWFSDYVAADQDPSEPVSDINYPVYDIAADQVETYNKKGKVVALVAISFYWRDMIENILPPGADGVVVVFENECNPTFTFQINGPDVVFLGRGDHHNPRFDYLEVAAWLTDRSQHKADSATYTGVPLDEEYCPFYIRVFPSTTMEDDYITNNAVIFTAVSVMIFVFTAIIFLVYDVLVERRQRKVYGAAKKSTAIVSSLFPSNVRDRLFDEESNSPKISKKGVFRANQVSSAMKAYGGGDEGGQIMPSSGAANHRGPAIADLFPEATVMFADIAGFTAWSSTRDPQQVFCLLEAVYGAFDILADRRKVFKVETIGDSYVAACGLPEPRPNHALVMCKFARDCREKFNLLTRQLEKELGPDTADLMMRFGLNSGPVTAGVLRGQKSRFQLFGDTVNTASRMESNGVAGRIQASQSTVDFLLVAGKTAWVRSRKDKVTAKGKGEMQTYWIEPRGRNAGSVASGFSCSSGGDTSVGDAGVDYLDERTERLIEWNTDILARMIRQIMARRQAATTAANRSSGKQQNNKMTRHLSKRFNSGKSNHIAIDEVQEVIELPAFDPSAHRVTVDPDSIQLDPVVMGELRDLVLSIAASYLPNSFHNFEHCSHVTMSVTKLLGRIVSPDVSSALNTMPSTSSNSAAEQRERIARSIYDQTYGITSDPMTQFACVFSALIHDVGHTGVPNAILAKESPEIAARYRNQSLAEQHSVEIAWDLLMEDGYKNLRRCVFSTQADQDLFRKLVVNSVMATDIFDKELGQLRKSRWEKAFAVQTIAVQTNNADQQQQQIDELDVNRKATIVIEHVIQASDVAHTMQHWHIYQRWNQRLFNEMYQAFHDGRSENDPSLGWYKGELWFFDNYVIPLSKKLKECGVFGVSSDEYLSYALQNRKEWERKGESIVKAMVEQFFRGSNQQLDELELDAEP